jgi:hypothetical protein
MNSRYQHIISLTLLVSRWNINKERKNHLQKVGAAGIAHDIPRFSEWRSTVSQIGLPNQMIATSQFGVLILQLRTMKKIWGSAVERFLPDLVISRRIFHLEYRGFKSPM